MIKSSEYIHLLKTCNDVFNGEMAFRNIPDYFFENMDLLRKQWQIIKIEYKSYALYPRHNMEKFHEAISLMIDYCEKTDVKISWCSSTNLFNEQNWGKYNKFEFIAFFNYEGINITKLLDFH